MNYRNSEKWHIFENIRYTTGTILGHPLFLAQLPMLSIRVILGGGNPSRGHFGEKNVISPRFRRQNRREMKRFTWLFFHVRGDEGAAKNFEHFCPEFGKICFKNAIKSGFRRGLSISILKILYVSTFSVPKTPKTCRNANF